MMCSMTNQILFLILLQQMKTYNLIENSFPISCTKHICFQFCFELVMNSCWIYYRRKNFKFTIKTITHFHFHFSFPFLNAMDAFWFYFAKKSKFISYTIEDNNINLKFYFNYLHVDVHQIITKKLLCPCFISRKPLKIQRQIVCFSKGWFKPCFFVSPNTPQVHLIVVQQYFIYLFIIVTPSWITSSWTTTFFSCSKLKIYSTSTSL